MTVTEQGTELAAQMLAMGRAAKNAAKTLALVPAAEKNKALYEMTKAIRAASAEIRSANTADLDTAREAGRPGAFIDRLTLTEARIGAMAQGLEDIADLADPVGEAIASWTRPNGLEISRIRVPLGVIGMIYESRPNVTADAGGLCLKSGNAVILRGGSEAIHSNRAIHAALLRGLAEAGLDPDVIQLVQTTDREAVGMMLAGLDGAVDVIVPRGGKSLVARVQDEARVPVFAHLDGNCHVYVHASADLDMARDVAVNAKMRRTGICGAAETLLVDEACASTHLGALIEALIAEGCEVRGDEAAQAADPRVKPAADEDWATEYLDAVIAVKVVSGLDEAIAHIEQYGSHHTDAIIADDLKAAQRFLREVDSAIVMHNASTQFADGGQFGMGAEIGIATGRFHARGPVGVEQLTTFKYCVSGSGQVRPA